MLSLKALQTEFQSYLMNGNSDTLFPEIAPDERFSAHLRLKIYYDGYRLRLHEVLQSDFSKTLALLGEDNFEIAFLQYLEQYPSQHFSVRYFGQHFPAFLANATPFKDYPIFKEMAQFEWLVSYTIDAKDAPFITMEALSTLPPEAWPSTRFFFHPSVTSEYFAWDTPQLWQAIDREEPSRAPVKQPEPVRWLFWRKGIRSYFRSCTPAEDSMFQGVLNGFSFGEICENLIDLLPENDIPQIAAQTLFQWINEEMITRFE